MHLTGSAIESATADDLSISPWDSAKGIRRFFILFMLPFIRLGEKSISSSEKNQFKTASFLRAKKLNRKLEKNYNYELMQSKNGQRRQASFVRAIFKSFAMDIAPSGFFYIIAEVFWQPLQIVALGWLIRDTTESSLLKNRDLSASKMNETIISTPSQVDQDNADLYWKIIFNTSILILSAWMNLFCQLNYMTQAYHTGLKCRIATMSLVYSKVLRLNQAALNSSTTGRLTNLLSNDVVRFEQLGQAIIYLISSPLQTIVIIYLMQQFYIGILPTLACVFIIIVITTIQTFLGSFHGKLHQLTARRTDERIRLVNELITGIRIIKMYAWEVPLNKLVEFARRREINMIAITSIFKTISSTLFLASDIVTIFASIVTYILLGNEVSAEKVFVTVAFCSAIKLPLMLFFPTAIGYTAEAIVSCNRINDFLHLTEHSIKEEEEEKQRQRQIERNYHADTRGKPIISYNDVSGSWKSIKDESDIPSRAIMRNLTMQLNGQQLLLVAGRVGSGKSTFLMSMLREFPIETGKIQINGKISYCSQEPWIFPGTLRDNILFGLAFDQDRYNEVIRVCSLTRDLEILPNGQMTLVGERGVALSGGQKARVNLARALYHRADIYLLDDPLSAVDAPVARDIFANAIKGFLKDKTVVLATHQLQFLQQADYLLIMDCEKSYCFGTVNEIMQSQSFKDLDFNDDNIQTNVSSSKGRKNLDRIVSRLTSTRKDIMRKRTKITSLKDKEKINNALSMDKIELKKPLLLVENDDVNSLDNEDNLTGDLSSYKYYISCATNFISLFWFITIIIISQFAIQYGCLYLSFWTDSAQRKSTEGPQFKTINWTDSLSEWQLIMVFLIIVLITLISCFLCTLTFYLITLNASITIHKRFFKSIINAPMKFFDFNPIGILLNRFGRDMGMIDEILPQTFFDMWTTLLPTLSLMILSIYVDIWNGIASFVILAAAIFIRAKLAKIIIKLKHLEGNRGDVIFSHISTSLDGLTTIRAFNSQQLFMEKCDTLLDNLSSINSLYYAAARFLSMSIDILSSIFITSIILECALTYETTTASSIGLVIARVIQIPNPIEWGIRQMVEAECQMTSVQRVKDYSGLEREEELDDDFNCCIESNNADIQSDDAIKFTNVSLKYFDNEPFVLNELNLTIKRSEKIGIVGRTGAGKSSIIATLFRLYPFEGSIEIDGQDIKYMSLKKLRSSIGIIPQDPVLFAGSIRKNLDPFGEHSDQELWSALEAVQLQMYFANTDAKLEHEIQESGSNLSVGQRQLICLARAIIRRNNILVLDEATANVDPETDAFIQSTIKEQFANCTVITIAHRLITIADSDRVLVLDQGQVKEFDEPYKLLQNKAGIFSQMVESTLKQQAQRIKSIAKDKFNKLKLD